MNDGLVYDVGMNNGDDTAYYLHRGYDVVAIEAAPDLCAQAAERFADKIDAGRLTIVNVGITAEPGNMEFWICETCSAWNSFKRRIASRDGAPHHSIDVPCETFDAILERYGTPYYLKVDIEGHDLLCLEALQRADELPRYVSVEIGPLDGPLEILNALGYSGYKCISQFNFLPLEATPTRAQRQCEFWTGLATGSSPPLRLLRKAVGRRGRARMARRCAGTRRRNGWVFPPGSSGPFGESTLGQWYTAEQVRDLVVHHRGLCDQGVPSVLWQGQKDYSFWMDLHARMSN